MLYWEYLLGAFGYADDLILLNLMFEVWIHFLMFAKSTPLNMSHSHSSPFVPDVSFMNDLIDHTQVKYCDVWSIFSNNEAQLIIMGLWTMYTLWHYLYCINLHTYLHLFAVCVMFCYTGCLYRVSIQGVYTGCLYRVSKQNFNR